MLKEATMLLLFSGEPSQRLNFFLNMTRPDRFLRLKTASSLAESGVTCKASWLILASFSNFSSEFAWCTKDSLNVW